MPLPTPPTPYLTATEARQIAPSIPGTSAVVAAAADADLAAALTEATSRVDTAYPYQGRRYEPYQVREFPRWRVSTTSSATSSRFGLDLSPGVYIPAADYPATPPSAVWDYDPAADGGKGAVVVPWAIVRAVLLEATAILTGDKHRKLAEDRQGLTGQSIGGASESYDTTAGNGWGGRGGPGGAGGGLCPAADREVQPYIRSHGSVL